MSVSFLSENSGQAYAQKKTTRTYTSKKSTGSKKKSATSSAVSSPAIAKYQEGSSTYSLLANGTIKTSDKCTKGKYEKVGNGAYYVLRYGPASGNCGDFTRIDLIVGNDVYLISHGSQECITDFNYDAAKNSIYILKIDGVDADKEMLAFAGFKSRTVPLSNFRKIGKIEWVGGVSSNTGVSKEAIDKKLKEYEALVDEVYNDNYVEGVYFPPKGSGWQLFIAPVVDMKNDLSKMEKEMTSEQKAKFNSLSAKIKDVFTKR